MGRPRKMPEVDLADLRDRLMDLYNVLTDQRDPTDFGGHDYAYKTGYAQASVEQILTLMGVQLEGGES